MRYAYAFLLCSIGYFLQSTVLIHLSVFGTAPNLMLCLILLLSFLYEGHCGIVLGIFFGLIQDLSFALIIGPSSLTYLLVALIMNELRRYLYRDSVLNILLASLIGTTTYYGINWSILAIFGGTYRIQNMLLELPILLGYHFIIMVMFYALIGRRSIRHPEDRYYKGNRSFF